MPHLPPRGVENFQTKEVEAQYLNVAKEGPHLGPWDRLQGSVDPLEVGSMS